MQTTCVLSITKHNGFYFIGVTVQLPSGKTKYFTDMCNKDTAKEFAEENGIELPE
jgi:hypothetical protein